MQPNYTGRQLQPPLQKPPRISSACSKNLQGQCQFHFLSSQLEAAKRVHPQVKISLTKVKIGSSPSGFMQVDICGGDPSSI